MSTNVSAGARFRRTLSPEKTLQIISAVNVPLLTNLTGFVQTPLLNVEEPGSVGVGMVLYPLSAFRAMSKAAENVYTAIGRDGHQKNVIDQMQTRDELHDRIGYHDFEQKLDTLFASKK